jgi:hypothetical protein
MLSVETCIGKSPAYLIIRLLKPEHLGALLGPENISMLNEVKAEHHSEVALFLERFFSNV